MFLKIAWCQWLPVALRCLNPDEFCLHCSAVSSLYQPQVASSRCSESWRLGKIAKGFKVESAVSAWERKTSNPTQSAIYTEHSRGGSGRLSLKSGMSPECDAFAGMRTRILQEGLIMSQDVAERCLNYRPRTKPHAVNELPSRLRLITDAGWASV